MGFDAAFEKTVGLEGGFDNDRDDSGNWTGGRIGNGALKGTKYGISAAQYPDLDIENLSLEEAKAIYYRDYWKPLNLDGVANWRIQAEIFDTAVNLGVARAAKIIQRAVNFLEIGTPLAEDGRIGPATLGRVNLWCAKDPEALFRALNGFQFMWYFEIASAGTKEKYARGWMKRIQDYREA
jgi:lysozyme family protein